MTKNNTIFENMDTVHRDLLTVKELLYDKCDFLCSIVSAEKESAEYGAYFFEINSVKIRFRVAKTTPTKVGQFVTVWKRIENGPTQPYDSSDSVDFFIINTKSGDYFGQFVFSKSVLIEHNIFSTNGKDGKRGIRVYPLWDKPSSNKPKKHKNGNLNIF